MTGNGEPEVRPGHSDGTPESHDPPQPAARRKPVGGQCPGLYRVLGARGEGPHSPQPHTLAPGSGLRWRSRSLQRLPSPFLPHGPSASPGEAPGYSPSPTLLSSADAPGVGALPARVLGARGRPSRGARVQTADALREPSVQAPAAR